LTRIIAVSLLLHAAAGATAPPLCGQAANQNAFIVFMAGDTLAVENFTRAPDRIEGEITGTGIGRLLYTVRIGPAATVGELSFQAWMPGVAPAAAPLQDVRITMTGDSAIVHIGTAAGVQTQRIASQPGAMPYLNPSFVLVELVLARARALGGDRVDVPLFMVQGGQTVPATVVWHAPDSATITIAGSEMHARVADGDITAAAVPAQRLTVVRLDGAHATPIGFVPPDYSAPEGAPYTAEDVTVPATEGHTLAGTLTRPRTAERVAAVVMITGSGAQDRDQAIPSLRGYRPFREVADTLARRGVAVLRMDDRGFGASTGDFAAATSADFANDVRAALAYLRGRPDIDADRLGLIGHSEGGLIAPMVAATDTALRGIVIIAGPSQAGREIIEFQQRYAIEHSSTIPAASRDSALAAARQQLEDGAARQPWLRYFLDHDPLPVARRVSRAPVLILHGSTDRQVPADQAEQLGIAFREAGNRDVTVHVFPDVNHLLLRDADGNFAGYAELPDRGVVPEVRGVLADWVVSRFR
jgi:uncharacterized protein